jgi:uncharacterized membrane protein
MEHQHDSVAGADGPGTERLAAFSDGVIAIIITIMVLELKLPESASHGEFWPSFLKPLAPKLAIYALSFCIVGTMWINHHQLLAAVRRGSPQLMWMNLLLLFFMSLIPLATSFLGEHAFLPRAIAFYALILALSSVVFSLLRYHLGRLPEHDRSQMPFRRATLVRSFASSLLYAAAAILAAYAPLAALALMVFVPVMFNIPLIFGGGRPH